MLFTPPSDLYLQALVAETTGRDAYEDAEKQVRDRLHALVDAAHLYRENLLALGLAEIKRENRKTYTSPMS